MASNTKTMRAMQLTKPGQPLALVARDIKHPDPGQVLLRVSACGVCRTDLHIIDGELPALDHPIIPGHEVVGTVVETGPGVEQFKAGERIGVPWLGWTCGVCHYCRSGRENLCDDARFTGYHLDGGYADYVLADSRYCFRVPDGYSDAEAAPLLCAGLIGYRSLLMAGDAERLNKIKINKPASLPRVAHATNDSLTPIFGAQSLPRRREQAPRSVRGAPAR